MEKKAKKKNRFTPLDWIIAGALFVAYALLFPFYRLGDFIIAGIVCFGMTGIIAFYRRKRAAKQPAPIPASGDKTADALIAQGRRSIERLEGLQRILREEAMQNGVARITEVCRKVFLAIAEKPERASSARTFTEYYLPTALNLLDAYARLQDEQIGVAGGHIESTRNEIRASLSVIAEAFERQLDTLYRDEWMDISADIAVLEGMFTREGLQGSLRNAGTP